MISTSHNCTLILYPALIYSLNLQRLYRTNDTLKTYDFNTFYNTIISFANFYESSLKSQAKLNLKCFESKIL